MNSRETKQTCRSYGKNKPQKKSTSNNSLWNYIIAVVAIVQDDLEHPRCTNARNLSPNGQHFLVAQHVHRPQSGAVDDQVHLPAAQNTFDTVHLGLDELSAHVDEPVEQIRQQSHRLAREGREMVTTGVVSTVLIA